MRRGVWTTRKDPSVGRKPSSSHFSIPSCGLERHTERLLASRRRIWCWAEIGKEKEQKSDAAGAPISPSAWPSRRAKPSSKYSGLEEPAIPFSRLVDMRLRSYGLSGTKQVKLNHKKTIQHQTSHTNQPYKPSLQHLPRLWDCKFQAPSSYGALARPWHILMRSKMC